MAAFGPKMQKNNWLKIGPISGAYVLFFLRKVGPNTSSLGTKKQVVRTNFSCAHHLFFWGNSYPIFIAVLWTLSTYPLYLTLKRWPGRMGELLFIPLSRQMFPTVVPYLEAIL